MKGKDITKMSAWTKLAALGFTPIVYHGQMGFWERGASLVRGGREVIEIEPTGRKADPWSVSVKGGAETWKPQPNAPLSRYDTAGQAVYQGQQRYVPIDSPFGGYAVNSRGILAHVTRLVNELR